ncbi:hypothetical protein PTI98_000592 [Pleurotus ostreatus]|nr:hypothetical protein PTI98_000592 [Pleurotus ostreatus]
MVAQLSSVRGTVVPNTAVSPREANAATSHQLFKQVANGASPDWFQGADNPSISFREVQCPSALTSISGCSRHDGSGLPTVTAGPSTPSSSSSSAPSTPTTTTTPGGGGGGGAAQYAQCGGIGWSGATTCVSPFTCTKLNDYYSQCL